MIDYSSVPQPDVDDELYQEQRQVFPTIGYNARAGLFYIAAENEPAGDIPPGFALQPSGDNYETSKLPLIVLGLRKRLVAEDDDGLRRYYRPFTRRENMIGRIKRHVQALVLVPGFAEPFVFGAHGLTACASWDNPATGRRLREFGPGVEAVLNEEQALAKRQGVRLPLFAWIATLEPLPAQTVGKGRNTSQARPFGVTALEFVGVEAVERYGELARQLDVPGWIAEWDYAASGAAASDDEELDDDEAPGVPQPPPGVSQQQVPGVPQPPQRAGMTDNGDGIPF